MRLLIQVIESASVPEPAIDYKVPGIQIQGEGVGPIGLYFHCVGAHRFSGLNDTQRLIEAAIMIGGKLSNDIGRVFGTDRTSCDFHFRSPVSLG